MKVLVPVKRVIDYNVKVRVKADGSGVDLANVKMSMNPFDEIAVEEAIRLKRGRQGRRSHRGVHRREAEPGNPAHRAGDGRRPGDPGDRGRRRAHRYRTAGGCQDPAKPSSTKKQPGLVLCGKQAIDNDMNATGQMLAALLGWSQATFASKVDIDGDHADVTREVDGGLQTIKVKMPAIVTVDLRLNEPRYASLPNIMKAKKKPLDEKTPADYGVDVTPRLAGGQDRRNPSRARQGSMVKSVDELVAKLKEAGVI